MGGDEAPRSKVGSKQLADNSIRAYEKHFRSFNAFLGMIGDYESDAFTNSSNGSEGKK